jgi:hypothetical protein
MKLNHSRGMHFQVLTELNAMKHDTTAQDKVLKKLDALRLDTAVQEKQQTLIFVDPPFSYDVESYAERIYYTDALKTSFAERQRIVLYGLGGVGYVTSHPN